MILISPEERNKKPYALAVQCIVYKSIEDSEVRQMCNNVVKEMIVRGMKVAGWFSTCVHVLEIIYMYVYMYRPITLQVGFTTNGEWNSLRSKGNSRHLSIFEVCSLVR